MHLARKSLLIALVLAITGCANDNGWQNTRRDSAQIAPNPDETKEAVLQVYGADVYGWRGKFAIHTWIAAKPTGASQYTVYEVKGWRLGRGLPAVRIATDVPDRHWYGAKPELLFDKRGSDVDELIAQVDAAARRYPWANQYTLFPGPNSNTFPAWIADQVAGFDLDLPLSAIGQSWHK